METSSFVQDFWRQLLREHPQRARLRRLLPERIRQRLTQTLLHNMEREIQPATLARQYLECHDVPKFRYPANRVLVMSAMISTARQVNERRAQQTQFRARGDLKEDQQRFLAWTVEDQNKLLAKAVPLLSQLVMDALQDSKAWKKLPETWSSCWQGVWRCLCCCCLSPDKEEPPPDMPVTDPQDGHQSSPIHEGDPEGLEPLPEPVEPPAPPLPQDDGSDNANPVQPDGTTQPVAVVLSDLAGTRT